MPFFLSWTSFLRGKTSPLALDVLDQASIQSAAAALHAFNGPLALLASEASAYITSQTLYVDGGITVGAVRALPRPPQQGK